MKKSCIIGLFAMSVKSSPYKVVSRQQGARLALREAEREEKERKERQTIALTLEFEHRVAPLIRDLESEEARERYEIESAESEEINGNNEIRVIRENIQRINARNMAERQRINARNRAERKEFIKRAEAEVKEYDEGVLEEYFMACRDLRQLLALPNAIQEEEMARLSITNDESLSWDLPAKKVESELHVNRIGAAMREPETLTDFVLYVNRIVTEEPVRSMEWFIKKSILWILYFVFCCIVGYTF